MSLRPFLHYIHRCNTPCCAPRRCSTCPSAVHGSQPRRIGVCLSFECVFFVKSVLSACTRQAEKLFQCHTTNPRGARNDTLRALPSTARVHWVDCNCVAAPEHGHGAQHCGHPSMLPHRLNPTSSHDHRYTGTSTFPPTPIPNSLTAVHIRSTIQPFRCWALRTAPRPVSPARFNVCAGVGLCRRHRDLS